MGLGILESRKLRHVPGTATLDDLLGRTDTVGLGPNVKRSPEGIILEPQPSDDPEDPLNWPLWQRDLLTFLLCMLSVLASTLSPLLAANTITLITYFGGLSVTDAALLTGYHLLGVGVSGPFFVASARVYGKRHLFIIAPIIIIASSIWGGCAGHNYNSLVAARFFQGVGLAPFEGLVNAAVGEIYFVHESGKRLALTNLCLFGGAFFTPVLVGRMTLSLGWPWTFFFIAIFTAVVLPFVYLFCPETAYNRPDTTKTNASTANLVSGGTEMTDAFAGTSKPVRHSASIPSFDDKQGGFAHEVESQPSYRYGSESKQDAVPVVHHSRPRKLITRKNLALFNGRKSNENIFLLTIRPLPLFFHPAVFWACLTQGAMIAWTALLGVCLAIIMLGLGFNEAETGYMYTGAFVGALVAFILAGLISDPAARWMTRRNKGIFEPEFRLVLVIPMALIGISGLFCFGYTAGHIQHYRWLPPDVFFGFVVGGMTLGAIVSAQYLVDAHRDMTVEGFTCLLIFKNLIAYGITIKGLDWLLEAGTQKLFFMLGYAQIAICALSIPMYFLGKKNRAFFARHDILRMLRLK